MVAVAAELSFISNRYLFQNEKFVLRATKCTCLNTKQYMLIIDKGYEVCFKV